MNNTEFKWDDSLIKEFLSENFFSYALNQTLEDRLNKFKESKQPKPEMLFISKDGVPIHKNQKFYYVDKLYRMGEYWADECWTYGIDGTEFASKLAAEEYILMNKPLLSVNEVLDILQGMYYSGKLVEKAKENLNK